MTTVTEALVDAKIDEMKAELRLEISQAFSEILLAIERQNTKIEQQGADFRIAIEEHNTKIEQQNTKIEQQGAALGRRLAAATYWLFGAIVAGHAATIGVVAILINNI